MRHYTNTTCDSHIRTHILTAGSDTDSDTSSSEEERSLAMAPVVHVDADGYADTGYGGDAWVKAPGEE